MRVKGSKLIVCKLRGKEFSSAEVKIIDKLVKKHFGRGRTYISVQICKKLDWKQPNGWLKDRACREVLREFHKRKLISLPRSKRKKKKEKENIKNKDINEFDKNLLQSDATIKSFEKIKFLQVKGSKQEDLWNKIVATYHYLGFKTFVGRSLKYLIYYEEKILGAIGFCDPAWQLIKRDELCKEMGILESEIRWKGINNGRFLILPWIKTPNLASNLLAKSVKLGLKDWEKYYCVKPLYIETFVDPKRFLGTCYKADNWKLIGRSKGYKKSGANYSNSQVPKLIFIKFFNKNISQLKRTKINI